MKMHIQRPRTHIEPGNSDSPTAPNASTKADELLQEAAPDGIRWLILPALRLLAEKARFSQHDASPEELDALRQAAEAEVQQLRAEPSRWKRLWCRWGLVLY